MRTLAAPPSRSARLASAALLLAALAALAAPGVARAQQAPPGPAQPAQAAPLAPEPPGEDVVVLGDDSQIRGRVLDVRRGELVVVRDLAGRDHTVPWSNVRRVQLAPGSAAAIPAASGPVAGSGQEALGVESERARLANRLVVGGAVAWTFGYVLSAIAGAAGLGVGSSQQEGHGASCFKNAPYAFIPVVGAAVAAAEYPRHTIMGENGFVGCGGAAPGIAAFGIIDTIVQVGGAGVLIGGLAYAPSTPAPRSGSLLLTPGAAGAQAGLTASFRW